jgi:hypothetical protein
MRLWTIDPSQLDAIGLIALWREGLLAQAVLANKTVGYKHHPQLNRFRHNPKILGSYLHTIYWEAVNRGYKFDSSKIENVTWNYKQIKVTSRQIDYEMKLLQSKLNKRLYYNKIVSRIINPVFIEVDGNIENWEKIK